MAFDKNAVDQAFEKLLTHDWGGGSPCDVINGAVRATHGDEHGRSDLERRLVAVLAARIGHPATLCACRVLMLIGTAASVPALGNLLGNEKLSHVARLALERIPAAAAGDALRKALGEVQGGSRIGIISSLAARGDAKCVPALANLLSADAPLAVAAADALDVIGTPEAIAALQRVPAVTSTAAGRAVANALLTCAERLLSAGNRADARKLYDSVATAARGPTPSRPPHPGVPRCVPWLAQAGACPVRRRLPF